MVTTEETTATVGTYFDPVRIARLRVGDVILAPTSPGFVLAEVTAVRVGRASAVVDIKVGDRETKGAWVEFGRTGNALVQRPSFNGREPIRRF